MEVRLDAAGDLPVPLEDVFLSIRVGDVQKQSRLAKTRTYRFPDSGGGRFGRLEVYRRVGVLTVSLNAADGDGQDISVPCELPGMQHLGLRMAVKGGQGASAKAEALPTVDQKGHMHKRMDAAQRYMSAHRLEEILADAMREVLNTKPADPLSFLSSQLLKHRKPGDSLPPVPGVPQDKSRDLPPVPQEKQKVFEKLPPLDHASHDQAAKAAPPPPADEAKEPVAGGSVNQKRLMRQRSSRRLSLPGVEGEGQPIIGSASVECIGSRAYYAAHFAGSFKMQSGLARLYSKFATKEVASLKEVATLGSRGYYKAHFAGSFQLQSGLAPLYGKFAVREAAKPAAPRTSFGSGGFKTYYVANIVRSIGSSGFAGLYAKFGTVAAGAKPRAGAAPEVYDGSQLLGLPRKVAAEAAPRQAGNFLAGGMAAYYGKHMRGSSVAAVTSLYAKFPAPKGQNASGPTSASQLAVLTGGGFSTYYKSTIVTGVAADSKPMQDLFQKFAGFSAASDRCTAKQAAAPPFVYRASVGSWLARTPAQVTPSWCFMDAEKKSPQVAPAPQAPTASSKLALPAFGAQASVGTWLVPKPPPLLVEGSSWTSLPSSQPAASPPKPWNRRPSVGTWLAPAPAEEAPPLHQPLLKRRQDSLLAMDPAELLQTFQRELAAKDREIEELKRLIQAKG